MSASSVALRPMGPDDEPFLRQVYASTRLEELAPLGWNAEQQDAFLRQQFDAQHRHYQTYFADAEFSVILRDDRPVGRLYVARRPEQIIVIDIALLPEHRGAGIGSRLLRALIDEAEHGGKPVRMHVEKFNPARRLYERLGFSIVGDAGVYWALEWTPAHASGTGAGVAAPAVVTGNRREA